MQNGSRGRLTVDRDHEYSRGYQDMGKMLGGDEEKDPDAAKKEEERQEALRQQEEERKAKYAKMEAEREVMRQGIRDKCKKPFPWPEIKASDSLSSGLGSQTPLPRSLTLQGNQRNALDSNRQCVISPLQYGIKKKEEKEAEAQAALEANAEGSLTRPKKAIPPGCGDEEEEEEESILDTVIKYLPGPLQDMFKK
ncbi:hypothetical protein DUI87_00680 [Hirundo rustica rustica]|uniref:Complexin-1 n=1 Tax=Hirundo rustica rustica TaxID=333673 RepID=A0A3M0LAE2_HIRRU|nr:hypothetical protein DUI87_00680 [Hirundo rustica rustica]